MWMTRNLPLSLWKQGLVDNFIELIVNMIIYDGTSSEDCKNYKKLNYKLELYDIYFSYLLKLEFKISVCFALASITPVLLVGSHNAINWL